MSPNRAADPVCPETTTGYDCTCAGNPRCKKATKTKPGGRYDKTEANKHPKDQEAEQ